MSIVINSNSVASQASLNMSRANSLLQKSLQRLSSGKRIVTPSDDAGGLAVGMKLESTMRRTAATKYNIQNGTSFLQVQDGALKVVGSILDRMAELKSFYNDVSKNALDRDNYNHEFKELQAQLNELVSSKFNGVSLFASKEPDNNPLKIITTEDGLTGLVELNRVGLFEKLKSKYGADGKMNTGNARIARQVVGDWKQDGNVSGTAYQYGQTTREYEVGNVVYLDATSAAGATPALDAGYYQVRGDTGVAKGVSIATQVDAQGNVRKFLKAGTKISLGNFIKIADDALRSSNVNDDGTGFAEIFEDAQLFDPSKSYKTGDRIKVKVNDQDMYGPGYVYLEVAAGANNSEVTIAAGTYTAAQLTVSLGTGTGGWNNAANAIMKSQFIRAQGEEFTRTNGKQDLDLDGNADNVGRIYKVDATTGQGSKIFKDGRYWVWADSAKDSTHADYVEDSEPGFHSWEKMVTAGAVVELSAHVATTNAGGNPNADPNVFYDANKDLKYIDRLPDSGMVRSNTIARQKNPDPSAGDDIYRTSDDIYYKGLNSGNDGVFGTSDDFYETTGSLSEAEKGYHIDADADNNKDLLDATNTLAHFSVADFVDYIQTLANFRAVNGGTMSRLGYAEQMLEENQINLEAATSRIMDADMAAESTKFARQNVLVQAGSAMVVQANQLANVVLALLG